MQVNIGEKIRDLRKMTGRKVVRFQISFGRKQY